MPEATVPRTVVIALLLAVIGAARAEAWTVKPADGPDGRCVLESSRYTVPDGYQQTSVYFSVGARSFRLVSAAPMDAAAGDLGVKVDNEAFVRIDRLEGDKIALFDSNYAQMVEQFKAGGQARVQLRFWPTWPATGTHGTTVSLIGFTKAYGELAACR